MSGLFDMDAWQQVVVAAVGVASLIWMSLAVLRLFSRRADDKATWRWGSAAESALFGGSVPHDAEAFDGWSYRVGARFAGRVRIVVYEHSVAVAGPRVPRRLYQIWVWAQALLLALVPPAAVAAIVTLSWLWLLVAGGVFLLSFAVSMGGAGLWPGLGELSASEEGGFFKALEFPLASVKDIDVGRGWSKGGFDVVLLPYKAGIDKMAGVRAVSFFAPDEHGREVRFAIHMHSDDDARRLSARLGGLKVPAAEEETVTEEAPRSEATA